MSKDQNPSDKACDAYFDNPCAATSGSYYSDRVTFYAGFAAGAASRDAEIARLKTVPMRYRRMAFNAQLQDEVARLEQERDHLRAHINVLRKALKFLSYMAQTTGNVMGKDAGLMDGIKAAEQALATPEQSLAASELRKELDALQADNAELVAALEDNWNCNPCETTRQQKAFDVAQSVLAKVKKP